MAIVYAALARAEIALRPSDRGMLLITVGTALTFVTLAIPVQLESNWITIAWGVEALVLLWASFEAAAPPLATALRRVVFSMALFRFLFHGHSVGISRCLSLPVFNRYFLGMLALTACLGRRPYLYQHGPRDGSGARMRRHRPAGCRRSVAGLECRSLQLFRRAGARATWPDREDAAGTAKQLRWAGQLSLSVLWSVFAGLMTAAGFRLHERGWRAAGLVLFGVTLVKVVFMDISELEQFYRILALLALGLVLLGVAWKYQRGLRREQAR